VNGRGGFTLVEVLVAVIVLVGGVLAYIAGAGVVSRMVGRGRMTTIATEAAAARLEAIRRQASVRAGSPPARCGALAIGPQSESVRGVTLSWSIPSTGRVRPVVLTVSYPVATGTATITVETALSCD